LETTPEVDDGFVEKSCGKERPLSIEEDLEVVIREGYATRKISKRNVTI